MDDYAKITGPMASQKEPPFPGRPARFFRNRQIEVSKHPLGGEVKILFYPIRKQWGSQLIDSFHKDCAGKA
jgi:hypothetical protein